MRTPQDVVPNAPTARGLPEAAGFWLAAGVPLVAYLATASGHGYWLDAGEFVAASQQLDIAHPPGHPLTALYGKLFALLPLGPLAFRIALGQAVAAALAAGCLFLAGCTAARAMGLQRTALIVPTALCTAWLWALGYGVWFQAVRPEVYALQGLLLLFAFERLVRVVASAGADSRSLYAAALALGLGLTNHHVMAVFMLPSLLLAVISVARRHGLSAFVRSAAFGCLGLCVYAYLPLRAAQQPPMNLGSPTTPERLFWVVSAQVYTRYMGGREPQPFLDRVGDVIVSVVSDLQPAFVLLASCGLYAALRQRSTRGLGLLCALCAVTVLGMRPWLGAVRGNPDAIGYMIAGVAALALLSCAGIAALAARLDEQLRLRALLSPALWLTALAALSVSLLDHGPQVDLSRFHAVDPFDDARIRGLPPRALVVLGTPQTVFRQFDLDAAEALRPDVAMLPLPFLRYPGVAEAVTAAHPDLAELVASFLASDRVELGPLLRLGAARPVFVEMDPHLATDIHASLLPTGLFYAVVNPQVSAQLTQFAARGRHATYARIGADLGSGAREIETSHQLLWLHYMDALHHAARGETALAREALAAATATGAAGQQDRHLAALDSALSTLHGPLDVRRFMQVEAPESQRP